MSTGITTDTVTLEIPVGQRSNPTLIAKAESLDQLRRDIIDSFEDGHSYDLWIVEIFDEYIIVKDTKPSTHWKITYTRTGNDVEFAAQNQWQEVKLNKEWVNKALSLKSRISFEEFEGEEQETEEDMVVSPVDNTIKALGQNRLGFYGMLWGDKANKDLHGEWFTEKTDGITELFDQLGQLPFTYHHAADPNVKSFVFGMLDTMTPDQVGMWCEVQIKKHKQYKQFIKPLVDSQSLYPSSETLVGAKSAEPTGEITRWVTSFMTGTTVPAECRMMDHPVDEVEGYFKSIGLTLPDEGDEESDEETDSEDITAKGAEDAQRRIEMLIDIELQRIELLQLEK